MSTVKQRGAPLIENGRTEDGRRAISVTETALLLGISRAGAYVAIESGAIPSIRIVGRILVPCAALERLLAGKSSVSDGAA